MELVIALDLEEKNEILKLAKELKDIKNIWLKVGFRTFIRDGKELIYKLKEINSEFKIFLDLKLYDIPNTMMDATKEIINIGVDMFNIHASSGIRAMEGVKEIANRSSKKPIILAVTALTSFDNSEFKRIYNQDIETKAIEFAKDAYKSGLDGVVCSVFESKKIKENTSKNFLTLTPGIRPSKDIKDDQKRVATIKEAKDNLVDFIVVGRPIYKSKNPLLEVKNILKELK
ncbi:MAG: orotidine-5'-phosphate decarboxylase [Epsilonproteobacteria bacterium]|nr:orotidine-5'-phosphate decarboxylase [Campylobacterota bacterium]